MRLGERQDLPASSQLQRGRQLPALGHVGQAKTQAWKLGFSQPRGTSSITCFWLFWADFLPCFFGPETLSWSWETFPSESHVEIGVFSKVVSSPPPNQREKINNDQLYQRYSDFALHIRQNMLLCIASTAAYPTWQWSSHLITLFGFSFSTPAGLVLGN